MKHGLANHTSAQYTRESVDDFLRQDLKGLTRRDVSLDAFLARVLKYDKDKWQPLLDSWNLSESVSFKDLQNKFTKAIKGKNEILSYRPLKDWADDVLTRAKQDKDAAPLIDLAFHLTHNRHLSGRFGKRRPDITLSRGGIAKKALTWADALLAFEFKLEKRDDEEEDGKDYIQEEPSKTDKVISKTKPRNPQRKSNSTSLKMGSGSRSQGLSSTQPGFNVASSSTAKCNSASKNSSTKKRKTEKSPPPLDVSNSPHTFHNGSSNPVSFQGPGEQNLIAYAATDPEVQLANYATQMLCSKELRDWTICVLIDGLNLKLWYYDRSHSFCSEPINLESEGESFAKFILALALCSKDRQNLGFSNLFQSSSEPSPLSMRYVDARTFTRNIEDYSEERFRNLPDENKIPEEFLKNGTHLRTKSLLHKQFTLFGRATQVEEVEVVRVEDEQEVSVSKKERLVLKLSYQVSTRDREFDLIKCARQIDPVHAPALLGYRVIDLDLPGKHLEKLTEVSKPKPDLYEERRLVLLLMRYYDDVRDLMGEDFVYVFRQGVRGMIHISVHNIVLTFPSTSFLVLQRGGTDLASRS